MSKFNEGWDCARFLVVERPERSSMREPTAAEMPDWRDEIFAVLKAAQIQQVGYVPDAGHARLIELCRDDPEIRTDEPPRVLPPRDGVLLKTRFRHAIGAE